MIFNLHVSEQMFHMALLLLKENVTVQNYFLIWNHAYMYKLWPRQAQFMTILSFDLQVWAWPSKYLNNVSNYTSTGQGEKLCQVIFKSMHKCTSYGPDKLNLWPFYHLTFKCDLDLQPNWTNIWNGTSAPQGEQLRHIFLKSMHYVEVMSWTNSIYDHFLILPSSVTLTFNLSEQMFQMALLLLIISQNSISSDMS